MDDYRIISLREASRLKDEAACWFSSKWRVPKEAYLECMDAYLSGGTELGWYLCLKEDRIVGGLGVIENDFHNRKDLTPNICAVFTEPVHRRRGIAGRLLSAAVEELAQKGISPVYLATDHKDFYERYGWEYFCPVQGDGEDSPSRMYVHRREKSPIYLTEITEDNWMKAAALSVKEEQRGFVAPSVGIIARGYVYRSCGAKVFVIENGGEPVGLALIREFEDEPLGYDLQQLMIDARYQGRGFGSAALSQILDSLTREAKYDHVEVCVKKEDTAAIRLYEKHGFVDSGYVDESVPDAVNMICRLF